jgi:hypothetical protein
MGVFAKAELQLPGPLDPGFSDGGASPGRSYRSREGECVLISP